MGWVLVIAGLIFLLPAARAQDGIEALERKCAAEAEQKARCTSACVDSTWPDIARCMNKELTPRLDAGKLEGCIQPIQARRRRTQPCELCVDPAIEAIICAAK